MKLKNILISSVSYSSDEHGHLELTDEGGGSSMKCCTLLPVMRHAACQVIGGTADV